MDRDALREKMLDTADGPDEEPLTAVAYLYELGEHTTVIDLLTEMLVATGLTEAEVTAALEKKAGDWLADQQTQWWEL
jgi:hypothetical protein